MKPVPKWVFFTKGYDTYKNELQFDEHCSWDEKIKITASATAFIKLLK